jgi:hypothetical protein
MKYKVCFILIIIVLSITGMSYARIAGWNAVDVRIISDKGGEFPKYRTFPSVHQQGTYYYMEAVKGERYSIEVANRSERRIGVVIAVDGRNIISGGKSCLQNTERMYIIEPYATNTFEGWRTSMERTNRFFFTEQSNSYAEKVFSDASAIGTIAVAVYREKILVPAPITPSINSETRSHAAKGKDSADRLEREKKSEQAGTGFGETTYSPAREVQFEPESTVANKIVLKYEWRTELCKKGIICCVPANRFWPVSDGFAPIPNDFRD